jgi:hypothetical protein
MTGIALKGTDLDLKIDSSIVASATDWSISPNREMIEITTLESGRGKIYMPDRSDYTLSLNGLVFRNEGNDQMGYIKMLNKMLNTDTSIAWSGTLDSSTTQIVSGWGYLSSAPIQVAQGSAVTYSAEAQGCGIITINTAL